MTIEQTDDGQWAVVRDGEQLDVHPNHAGAKAQLTRLAQAEQHGDRGAAEYDADEGPYPDNVGS